jgi:hypothetical protein
MTYRVLFLLERFPLGKSESFVDSLFTSGEAKKVNFEGHKVREQKLPSL